MCLLSVDARRFLNHSPLSLAVPIQLIKKVNEVLTQKCRVKGQILSQDFFPRIAEFHFI